MITPRIRTRAACLIMVVCFALWNENACGDDCYWIAGDGIFTDNNWINHVPGTGDLARFNSGAFISPFNDRTVTFNGSNSIFVPANYATSALQVSISAALTFARGSGTFGPTYHVLNSAEVASGKLITTFPISVGTATIKYGELDVTSSSFTVTSTSAGLPALEVGDPANSNATGTVKITGGAMLELTGASGNASVGVASGSSGEIDVSGAGSKLMLDGNASTLTVGDNGTGVLNITGGAVVDDNAALVGVHSSLSNAGYVTVDGASSLWTNRDHVSIGTAGVGLIPLSILTLANGGTTTVTGQLILNQHGQISGNGFINAGTFVTSGLIWPGAQIGSFYQAGALHITATTTQINSGGMRVTLAGTNAGTTYDQILFTGTTGINGSLTVELGNSFVPLLGNSFHILDLGSTSGTFSSVNLPSLSPGLAWNSSQLYTNGTLSVVSAGVTGDYNNNGTVDAADYVVWRKYSGTTHTLPNDPTGGTIGMTQYNTWRSHFGQPAGSGAGAAGSANVVVPEPNALVMIMFAAIGGCLRVTPNRIGVPATH